jgi:hypothetical protein
MHALTLFRLRSMYKYLIFNLTKSDTQSTCRKEEISAR